MAGRSIFVISGWRLGVNNSESQFGPKSFTAFLITFSFLNIFEQNQKEVLEETCGHLTIGLDFLILLQLWPIFHNQSSRDIARSAPPGGGNQFFSQNLGICIGHNTGQF